ncbi:MAG: lipase, partial [Bacteroidales bacterium]|nr:lipase [Bacteroidales bacterium]
TIEEIRERLFPFIEKLQGAHPGKPLIFQHTIYRERRNFDLATEKNESERMGVVDELMAEAVKRYKDVYYVTTTNATSPKHDTSVDGTHPGDHGYSLWAESIQKPILKILRKYGIR